jgi:Protein of unknown function (DUF2842)
MSPRLRKFLGMIAILAFLAAYSVIVVLVGDMVPRHWAAQALYYGVFGTAWGVPLFPLIRWMNREG